MEKEGGLSKADFTPKQKAMLDFAMKVCLRSGEIDDVDFERLRGHGFTDEDIWTSPPSSACPTAWPT